VPDSGWVIPDVDVLVGVFVLFSEVSILNLIIVAVQEEYQPDGEACYYSSVRYHQDVGKVAAPCGPDNFEEINHYRES